MTTKAYTVGQLAARCGVAVKTVQFYAEEGLLRARGGATDAGYRLFTDDDDADLRMIRSLRALGFSLDAIRGMLGGAADPRSAAQLQLEIVDTQLRSLRRQRTIIASALAAADASDLRRKLHLAEAAATLGAAERDAVVERFMDRVRCGEPLPPDSNLRRMIAMDLPDDLTDGQLDAWLELSALMEDETFIAVLHAQHDPFRDRPGHEAFGAAIGPIVAEAMTALADASGPESSRVSHLVERWVRAYSDGLGRPDDAAFRRWLLDYAAQTNDPRMQRFWELAGALKGRPAGVSPFIAAQQLLIDGLAAKLAG
jgi:DNA-binding transcriptional MerR regulator